MREDHKTTSSETNKRRSRRVGTSNLAKIECRKGGLGLGSSLLARPLDISETGIRLVLTSSVPTGQEMEVTMQGGCLLRPLRRLGEVIWALPLANGTCCVGLLFQKNLSLREVQALGRNLPR